MSNYYSRLRRVRRNLRDGKGDPTTKLIEAAYLKLIEIRARFGSEGRLDLELPIQTWGAFKDLQRLFRQTGLLEIEYWNSESLLLKFGLLTPAQAEHQTALEILKISRLTPDTIKILPNDLSTWSNDAYPEGLDVIAHCHKHNVKLTAAGIETVLANLRRAIELELDGDFAPLEFIFT
jgi:hypothetical protein